MSVHNRFMVEMYGFADNIRFWHVLFMVPSRWRTERIEDDSRPENKSDFCALRSYETVFRTRRASQGLLDIACPVIGRELL